MPLCTDLVRHDAETPKFFSFAASLKNTKLVNMENSACLIWFAATGRQEKRDKCDPTFTNELISDIEGATLRWNRVC